MELAKHLDKLEAFKAIAESGKLVEAAKAVNLTQPSLSRLIKTLEEATGTTLFYRSRSGTSLTPAGEELLRYTDIVLGPLKDLEKRMKNTGEIISGHLKVASYESLAEYLWPSFLLFVKKKYSNLSLSIKTSQSNTHLSSLASGQIDLLVDSEPRVRGDFDSFSLYTDHFGFYIHKKNLSSYLSEALIYVPSAFDENSVSLEQIVSRTAMAGNEKIELDSFTAARSFCESGLGVAILPTKLAERSKSKSLVKLKPTGIKSQFFGKHTIFATVHSSKRQDTRVKALIRELRAWFK